MLRIFKKIKPGKPAGENSGSFWRFAIAESVLIFLGILLALQVDNWNQDRQERILERVLLSEMMGNLRSDLEDIDVNLFVKARSIRSTEIVLEFLEGKVPWNDSLEHHLSLLIGVSIFLNNTTTYESLRSIGIDLIRNPSLRQQITYLYSASYEFIDTNESVYHKASLEIIYPSMRKHLDIWRNDRAVPLNRDQMQQSNRFKQDLRTNILLMNYTVNAYHLAREKMLRLIADLETELEK